MYLVRKDRPELTANHHGVDFFAQSVQSSLLFALGNAGYDFPRKTVTVFSFGNISFNNLTYPKMSFSQTSVSFVEITLYWLLMTCH